MINDRSANIRISKPMILREALQTRRSNLTRQGHESVSDFDSLSLTVAGAGRMTRETQPPPTVSLGENPRFIRNQCSTRSEDPDSVR